MDKQKTIIPRKGVVVTSRALKNDSVVPPNKPMEIHNKCFKKGGNPKPVIQKNFLKMKKRR